MMSAIDLLLVAGILVTVFVSFMVYYSQINTFVKLIILPMLLFLSLLSWQLYIDSLGKPIPIRPEGEYKYVAHKVTDKYIVLWTWTPEMGDRLYKWKYSRDDAKTLQKARSKSNGENKDKSKGNVILKLTHRGDGSDQMTILQRFSKPLKRFGKPREDQGN